MNVQKTWLNRLPRLNALYERIGNSKSDNVLGSYIRLGRFNSYVQDGAEWLEGNLAKLDSDAWEHLIKKVLPHSCRKLGSRGWQQFFDLLNECRGYVLLASLGYSKIGFIEEDKKKTPDLFGESQNSRALIEVKTVHRSDDDLKRNDPTFSAGRSDRVGDIINFTALAKKLIQKSDLVSTFLWKRLDKRDKEWLPFAH